MEDHEDIDLVLVEEPAAGQEEATVIISDQDEQEVPDQGEMHLVLEADLPEIVGLLGLKTADGFDRGETGPLQMVLEEYSANGILMHRQAQAISNPPGAAVGTLQFGANDLAFGLLLDLVVVAMATIVKSWGTSLAKSGQVSIDRTGRHLQVPGGHSPQVTQELIFRIGLEHHPHQTPNPQLNLVQEIAQGFKPPFLEPVGIGKGDCSMTFFSANISIGLLLPFWGLQGPRLVFMGEVKPLSFITQPKLHH